MICKSCRKKVDDIDIYCLGCGFPLDRFKQQFSLKKIIKQTNDSTRNQTNTNFLYNVVLGVILAVVICVTSFKIISPSTIINYIVQNALIILIAPFFMLQLAIVKEDKKTDISISQTLRHYPRLLLFTFWVALYFFFLKFICEGFFISFADPILNLVRLVLVLWGLAIVFPVPMLIIRYEDTPVLKLILKGYIAGKYLRWHQFSLIVMLGTMSIVSCLFVFLFFPTNIRFTTHLMNIWYKKQEEFKLYDRKSDY